MSIFFIQNRKPGPVGQVRDNRLCREHMPRNDGILECWPPARRAYVAYASERKLGLAEWDLFL
jgi:hypothetical protein